MTRALGTTGLHLTEPGFGGAAIGGLYAAVDCAQALQATQACADGLGQGQRSDRQRSPFARRSGDNP